MVGLAEVLERDRTLGKLTEEDAKTPNICFERIPRVHIQEHFWGCITKSPTVCVSLIVLCLTQAFGEAKINQLDVSSSIYNNIVRFQISVYNILLMKHLKRA